MVRAPDATHEEVSLTWPRFLPDHQRYLYRLVTRDETALYLASLDGQEPERRILELGFESRAEYVEPGYLVYKDRSEILVAQSVDPETLTATGTPVPVSQEVVANPFAWSAFSVSARTLIFQAQSQVGDSDNRLQWVDRGGNIVETLGQDGNYWRLAVSQDGRRVATTEESDIWLYEAAGNPTRITSHPAMDTGPTWAPDNRRIAFTSLQNGAGDIFVKDVASTEDGELLVSATGAILRAGDWSRDGQLLMLTRIGETSPSEDIWVHSFIDGTTEPVIQTRFNERHPQLSPDSRWLAYTSEEVGQPNVYVSSFPGPGQARRVSPSGGHQPRWRGDGGELYYLAPDHSLMTVAVSGEHELVTAPPERLFQMDTFSSGGGLNYGYDVTPDGDRFLTISRSGFASLSVVLNWRADLEAPTN